MKSPETHSRSAWAFAMPFVAMMFVMLMVFGSKMDMERLAPIIGVVVLLILLSPVWIWLRNRHELEKKKLETQALNPKEDPSVKRLTERLENLETILCRLDSEMNRQMEHSMSLFNRIADSKPEVSQMPTTMVQLASALENRYQILKELGRGGMGLVFQAYDKELKEQVALKILSPVMNHDAEAIERLRREVSAARRIAHPNVIRIFDLSETGGLYYVSMEFFAGTSLKEHIRQKQTLSEMEAFQIAGQIFDGLEAAHRQGVIHRDLKSQNILINSRGDIKIIDFGLARNTYMDGMTATGLIMGTPEYMAPEQVSGTRADERADIYSLGIILYEMFTGRLPFRGETPISIGFQQLKDEPPRPCKINPQLSPEIEKVILKALEKDPMNRYRSIAEFREAIQATTGTPSAIAPLTPPAQSQVPRQTE